METKQCSRCGEVKPLSRFYKKSANDDGLESQCKQCYTESRAEKRRAENEYLERCFAKNPKHAYLSRPEYVEEAKRQAKQQRKKKQEHNRQYARQHYAKNREKIQERNRQYYAKNREKIQEQIRKYQDEHREEIKEQRSQYNIEHREEAKERSHQYYIEHHEERLEYARQYRAEHHEEITECHRRWRAKNRERVNEYERQRQQKNNHKSGRRWRTENPNYYQQYRTDNAGKYRAYTANRYALSIAAEGTFTDEQFVELCDKYGNCCLCCGKVTKLTVDHIVPLSKGGSNDISNVQPLCQPCNSKKHTQTIDYRDTRENEE